MAIDSRLGLFYTGSGTCCAGEAVVWRYFCQSAAKSALDKTECEQKLIVQATGMAVESMVFRAFMLVLAVFASAVIARPDSAGIVEMVNGLAYGGIPYGSVTGQVADYYRRNGDLDLGRTLYDDYLNYNNFIPG
ncbi:hypothetical protein C0J52_16114 [Blattella germanica]|nr:hypothetical protein C0J52_16114 [Blattella germanica]